MVFASCLCIVLAFSVSAEAAVLLQENFDDTNFSSRGWYDPDGAGGAVSLTERIPGSTGSFQCTMAVNSTGCAGGTLKRHPFTATDRMFVSVWIKLSSNWVGSQVDYHPHIFYITSDLDGAYDGFSCSWLDTYIEIGTGGYIRSSIQDSRSINTGSITTGSAMYNPSPATENRSAAGCNGTKGSVGLPDCYSSSCPAGWTNFREFRSGTGYFQDGNWHKLEAYFQMNTISGGVGQADGILELWYDGARIISYSNVVYRTGQHPTMMWNKIGFSPYIGSGSPVLQTMWVDNLTVDTSRPGLRPNPPTNLQVP